MVDWFLKKLNFKLSDTSHAGSEGHMTQTKNQVLKPIEYNKGLEEIDGETPDEHRMLDDLEQDLEKLDQLMLEHRISKEDTHDFVAQGRKSIRLSQSEPSKGLQQEEEKQGLSS